jgi:hypothetical protein
LNRSAKAHVDDIQDDFETALVEARNHFLEFAQTVRHIGRVAGISGEESNRVLAQSLTKPFSSK